MYIYIVLNKVQLCCFTDISHISDLQQHEQKTDNLVFSQNVRRLTQPGHEFLLHAFVF